VAFSKAPLPSHTPFCKSDERSKNVKQPRLLDSFAMLAFLNKGKRFEIVKELMHQAEASDDPLLTNEINVGEVYYIAAKGRSPEKAEEFLRRLETSRSGAYRILSLIPSKQPG
jgi:predicted nucleic acid-binding protein